MSYTKIKGLSDVRRLPRLGKIRLGIRVRRDLTPQCMHKEAGACYRCSHPREVPYFVLPPEARAVYGNEPTELDIMFPVEDLGIIFPQAYKWYGSDQGLKCKGDGETALRRLAEVADPGLKLMLEQAGQQPDDLVEIPCPCPLLESGKCGPKGCLMVMLPRVSCGGVYQIDTGSVMNLTEINSTIEFVRSLLGQIAMAPLKLRRVPQEIQFSDPKTGKVTKKVHYCLKLLFEGNMSQVRSFRSDHLALVGGYEVARPVESGPDPSGECPAEINGEVFDIETGEVLSPPPPPPPPQQQIKDAPPNNSKPNGGNTKPPSTEALISQLQALILAEGITAIEWAGWLIHEGKLAPHPDGDHLANLKPSQLQGLISRWREAREAYHSWRRNHLAEAPPQELAGESDEAQEDSSAKVARAQELAPRVELHEGYAVVPSTSIPGVTYQVAIDEGGVGCECQGYSYRVQANPDYQCVHVMATKIALAMAAPPAIGGG